MFQMVVEGYMMKGVEEDWFLMEEEVYRKMEVCNLAEACMKLVEVAALYLVEVVEEYLEEAVAVYWYTDSCCCSKCIHTWRMLLLDHQSRDKRQVLLVHQKVTYIDQDFWCKNLQIVDAALDYQKNLAGLVYIYQGWSDRKQHIPQLFVEILQSPHRNHTDKYCLSKNSWEFYYTFPEDCILEEVIRLGLQSLFYIDPHFVDNKSYKRFHYYNHQGQ